MHLFLKKQQKMCPHDNRERNMKDNQNTGTKERSALFLLLFYQPDGKNKEYIAKEPVPSCRMTGNHTQ